MGEKKQPVLLALLTSILLFVSFVKDNSFSDPIYISKHYYFLFLMLPLLIAFVTNGFRIKRTKIYRLNYLDLAVIAFFCYSLIRAYFSPEIVFPHPDIIVQFLLVVVYWVIKTSLNSFSEKESEKFMVYLFSGFLIILLINSFWGISQLIGMAKAAHHLFKIGGSFGNPGPFSIYLVCLVPFTFTVILFRYKFPSGIYKTAIAALSLSVLLLPFTMARTAWLSFIIILFFFLWLKFKNSNWLKKLMQKKLIVLSGIVVSFVLLTLFSGFIWQLKKDSASGRLFIWKLTAQIISDAPTTGHGYDSFTHSLNDYQASFFENLRDDGNSAAQVADNATFAFNEFLQITAETGIIGLILFCLVIFFAFYKNRNRVSESKVLDALRLSAQAIILVILLSSLLSYPLHTIPVMILFYAALGTIAGTKPNYLIEISVNKIYNRLSMLLFTLLISSIAYLSINRFLGEKEWNKLQKTNRSLPPDLMYKKYSELEPIMKYNKYFMFNFGAELIYAKKFHQGITILEKTLSRLNDSNIHIYLGHAFFESGDLDKAEYYFKHASQIVPTKIFPLYNLVKVYQKTNQEHKALNLAQKIVSMGEKVETSIGNSIILEMNEYIKAH